ncbi:armadillo-type protein [Mycena latifolia]|nr:armadillo-type protein [Mycena latifolia]
MPPLTRQRTLESVLSWWSDSNPPGPTINLHAATKPLMRFMYHRQALGFVKRNHGLPLSPETLEIYWSYLPYDFLSLVDFAANLPPRWKYVSTATKITILEELETRAGSEEDAHVIVHSNIVHKILEILQSSPFTRPDSEVNDVELVSEFMSEIANSQALAFVKRNDGVRLMPETVELYSSYFSWKYVSTSTKIKILKELETRTRSEKDALVLIHSNMVYTILKFLPSTSYFDQPDLRSELETILRNLTSHSKSISAAASEPLVALLRRVGDNVMNDAAVGFNLLWYIADSSEGAEGVVAAGALPYFLDGLGSPSPGVCTAACRLTERLAEYQSTAAAVIDLNPCKQLVALSRQARLYAVDDYYECPAFNALIAIANWPDGAEAVVAAQVLDHVPKWFASGYYRKRQSACRLLEKLARHKSTAGAVMGPKLCVQLVTILELSNPDGNLAFYALEALASLAYWPDGAEAVVAAKALDHLTKLLVSRWAGMREAACRLLAALAWHESTGRAGARAVPRERLVALKRDNYKDVRESAAKALQALDNYLASAQVPMEAPGEPNAL